MVCRRTLCPTSHVLFQFRVCYGSHCPHPILWWLPVSPGQHVLQRKEIKQKGNLESTVVERCKERGHILGEGVHRAHRAAHQIYLDRATRGFRVCVGFVSTGYLKVGPLVGLIAAELVFWILSQHLGDFHSSYSIISKKEHYIMFHITYAFCVACFRIFHHGPKRYYFYLLVSLPSFHVSSFLFFVC